MKKEGKLYLLLPSIVFFLHYHIQYISCELLQVHAI